MTTIGSIGTCNGICAPQKTETEKAKDPISLYLQHRFEENKEQKLAELSKKHDAGEISDFQYKVEKYMIKHTEFKPIDTVIHFNSVA